MQKRRDWAKAHFLQISVISLLLLFVLISASSVLHKYLTVDESVYIAGGYSYLKTGDFRANIEHPVLGKIITAIPLFFLNPSLPLDRLNWAELEKGASGNYVGSLYGFSADFFEINSASFFQIVFSERMVVLVLSVFLAIMVFLWSKDLFGWKAGLLSLFLFVFEPNIIAHSQIATLDMMLTVFVFASFYFAFAFARSGKLKFLALSALFISAAILTKYTALVFLPLLIMFLLLQRKEISKNRLGMFKGKSRALYFAFILAVLIIVPLLLTNLIYAFDNYGKPDVFGVIPARMFDGYTFMQNWVSGGREGFLLGEFRADMPEYFLMAFLIKTTIPFLVLLLAAFYFFARKPELKIVSLLLPALAFFLAVSFFGKFYLGLRYVLPAFPFLFVFCGILLDEKTENSFLKGKNLTALLVLLLAFHAFSSLSIYPHYLSYFNESIGPQNAAKALSDSNLDWGQDLYYFMDFVRANNIEKVDFIYFGWPFYGANFPEAFYGPSCEPIKGKIAISVTILTGRDSGEHKCYEWLRKETPKAKIANTIYYYELS
ncbi:MAG: glycosyltransferase family 39 protein [Candidatus Diapherotrites archaeon]